MLTLQYNFTIVDNLRQNYRKIIEWFDNNKGEQQTELHYSTDFQLLVAVILSAQCTDKRVNMVTPALFERFPDVQTMSEASVEEVFIYIKSVSYPNNKAKYLVETSKMIVEKFGGKIPSNEYELQMLSGVGRKTANVILSVLYNQPKMAIDTHVFRVARRIGLSDGKTPLAVEKQLIANIDDKNIPKAHHWLILHGRYVCTARKPKCNECGITKWCSYFHNSSLFHNFK
jgi:endonuclease-3